MSERKEKPLIPLESKCLVTFARHASSISFAGKTLDLSRARVRVRERAERRFFYLLSPSLRSPEAMEIPSNDLDRLVFFEHARKAAEAAYAKNPLDADVCSS